MAQQNIDQISVRLLYPFIICFLRLGMFLLGPLKVLNKKRIPPKGGVLIVANHLANIDPVAIQSACPRRIYFIAKQELFDIKILGSFLRWIQTIPIKQSSADRRALKRALEILNTGNVVALFPEGGVSESGDLQQVLPGAVWLAKKAQVPILACGLVGMTKIMSYGEYVPRPALGWVKVIWGEAQFLPDNMSKQEQMDWIQGQLSQLIQGQD
jgi:1-acyl-sn-glycerol-3-phosphate acyltransferase